jgi:hypothetical protein
MAMVIAAVCAASGCGGTRATGTSPTAVTQTPSTSCTFTTTVTGAPFNAAGGNGTVSVVTAPGCVWTANAGTDQWIDLPTAGPFAGSATMPVGVGANRSFTGRSALIAIHDDKGGATASVAVPQRGAGCLYTVDPASQDFPWFGTFPVAETTTFGVRVHAEPSTCSWTATPTVPWITFVYISPTAGTGDAVLSFFVQSNYLSSAPRTGSIVIAGLSGVNPDATVTISEAGR